VDDWSGGPAVDSLTLDDLDRIASLGKVTSWTINARGILDPLQVCEDALGGYLIIDGERRYQIAENSGHRRLVAVIHPFMASHDREKLRLELKRASQPLTREEATKTEQWIQARDVPDVTPPS